MTFLSKSMAICGGVGSGKTQTAIAMAQKHQLHFSAEYMQMISEGDRLRFYDQSAEKRLDLMLNADRQRTQELAAIGVKAAILDRCVLCIFAHEYAMQMMNNSYHNDALKESIEEGELNIPVHLVFLTTTEPVRRERCLLRGSVMPDFFLQDAYNDLLLTFFRELSYVIPVTYVETTTLRIPEVVDRLGVLLNTTGSTPKRALRTAMLEIFSKC
jgi:hypothetical protein